ncbi:hypothetical protein ACJIZ3_024982 [Penstemon smallii]|uniref:LNS2/PITP domain-containing protein n=1 Tax=Penstemon smallii TaxID=265156 RepID=A0ABD3TV24_9LAMI
MQAVGRLGSYISRGVYTVSGPFHPFGGAVDIIVVLQPDGSYKSSPWYVRFGKFQGVLKSKEKLVSISVNGVEQDFHMHLDHKGEAYFLKEVDIEGGESTCSPPSSSGEDTEQSENVRPIKSKSCNYDAIPRTNSRRSQIMGVVFGRRKDGGNPTEGNASGVPRTESLDRAEMAADLLDLKWSTNLASPKSKKEKASVCYTENNAKVFDKNLKKVDCRVNNETGLVSQSSVEENGIEMKCLTTRNSIEIVEEGTKLSNSEPVLLTEKLSLDKEGYGLNSMALLSDVAKSDSQIQDLVEKQDGLSDASFSKEENTIDSIHRPNESSERVNSMTQLISEVKSEPERDVLIEQETLSIQEFIGNGDHITSAHEEKICTSEGTLYSASETIANGYYSQTVCLLPSDDSINEVESQNLVTVSTSVDPLDDSQISRSNCVNPCMPSSEISKEELLLFGEMDDFDTSEAKQVELIHAEDEGRKEVNSSFSVRVINDYINDTNLPKRRLRTTASDGDINTTGHVQSKEFRRSVRSLPNMSPISNNSDARDLGHSFDPLSSENNDQLPCMQSMSENIKIITESEEVVGTENGNATEIPKSTSDMEGVKNDKKENVNKKNVRTLIPTSDQLRSLNLKEGKNVVVFTFSTAMLGKQQVDARIYLWRWDTRIVISDVDGTITRSDLLGQVMPLVGMDWSQTGVAHLFSAIKENGYQFLFLSARAISQAFHTRQFLFNIKQDGKALPDGPVVISPDGLFPSLFREVVRRAPHEFKIACLEDIKVLFPVDANPFYAGFGNRDTDEFSYLKVGIPRNKIFIINPKGEIVVNRRVDTKSYVSLHGLVHGMFPPMSSSEQEDFNSWNYWKLPPPSIDD